MDALPGGEDVPSGGGSSGRDDDEPCPPAAADTIITQNPDGSITKTTTDWRTGTVTTVTTAPDGTSVTVVTDQNGHVVSTEASVPKGVAFLDVPEHVWYAEAVSWASARGIVTGYTDEIFGPGDCITREKLTVMLWRAAGRPAPSSRVLPFPDADQAADYAREALCWAVERGIIHGGSDGTLGPKGLATRAQTAQMLKNFLENG